MIKLLTTAKVYYWASILSSLAVVYFLIQRDFIGVGILLILSATLITIGFAISRKNITHN